MSSLPYVPPAFRSKCASCGAVEPRPPASGGRFIKLSFELIKPCATLTRFECPLANDCVCASWKPFRVNEFPRTAASGGFRLAGMMFNQAALEVFGAANIARSRFLTP